MPGELPHADADPVTVLAGWLDRAREAGVTNPTAMTVATLGVDGTPDARVVLLRGLDARGLVWFTNQRSPAGQQLSEVPAAAAVFYWRPLGRQVRVRGPVTPIADADADAYFATRPRANQLAAWASQQSAPIDGRQRLERAMAQAETRFAGRDVPRPDHWGGYLLTPDRVEFWIGRRSRLHDRRRFTRTEDGWTSERLQP